jgi:Meiotically up-regulated gene 113
MRRPLGFGDFVGKQGFHSLYIVTTEQKSPLKVGIAVDPNRRFSQIQTDNYHRLCLHRFWWLPGRPISERIAGAFKDHFKSRCVRGEWFDLLLSEAEAYIEAAIRGLGTWGVREAEMIEFMEYSERRRHDPYRT